MAQPRTVLAFVLRGDWRMRFDGQDWRGVTPQFAAEKRLRRRVQFNSPLGVIYQSLAGMQYLDAQCIDRSDNGLGFRCESMLGVGRMIGLEFREDDGTLCQRSAVLLYRHGQHYGACFITAGGVTTSG